MNLLFFFPLYFFAWSRSLHATFPKASNTVTFLKSTLFVYISQ